MQLVERHKIKKNSYKGKILDQKLFLSKNLYNSAIYHTRKHFKINKTHLNYNTLDKKFIKDNQKDYRALPAKVSQQILMQVDVCNALPQSLYFMDNLSKKLKTSLYLTSSIPSMNSLKLYHIESSSDISKKLGSPYSNESSINCSFDNFMLLIKLKYKLHILCILCILYESAM